MIIGIDHGYYAIKTKQVCFPTGLMRYTYEPYTMQNVLQYGGAYYVCGTGRQTLVKDKTANDNSMQLPAGVWNWGSFAAWMRFWNKCAETPGCR